MRSFAERKNFTDNPLRIYVSKRSGIIYPENEKDGRIRIETPLTGLSLLLYDFVGENEVFKIYELKQSLRGTK